MARLARNVLAARWGEATRARRPGRRGGGPRPRCRPRALRCGRPTRGPPSGRRRVRVRRVPRRPAAARRHPRATAPEADAVALLTAHAARGREWRVVAVPGVQEGTWPDLRLRGTLLGVERLVDVLAEVAEPSAAVSRIAPLLAEERRLFYVACTRARETLAGQRGAGRRRAALALPRRAGPDARRDRTDRPVHRPARALVLAELVGELRGVVCALDGRGPDAGDADARRRRAAVQLARLAAAGVPGTSPDDWYGVAPLSTDAPLREHRRGRARVAVGRRADPPLPAALDARAPRRGRGRRPVGGHRQPGARAGPGQCRRGGCRRAGERAARRLEAARPRCALVRPPRAGAGARDAGGLRRLGARTAGRTVCGWSPSSIQCSWT